VNTLSLHITLPLRDGSDAVRIFTTHPDVNRQCRDALLKSMSRANYAALDLALDRGLFQLVQQGEMLGVRCVFLADHHDLDGREHIRRNLGWLKGRPGTTVRHVPRAQAPSCCRLVDLGEYKHLQPKPDTGLIHGDGDGFLSALRLWGHTYPGMEDDADVLEGVKEKSLTFTGWLLREALHHMVPDFGLDPINHQREKHRVFQMMATWIAAGCPATKAFHEFATEVDKRGTAARRVAHEMVAKAFTLPSRIVVVDTIPFRTREPAQHEAKRLILKKYGTSLMCFVELDQHGDERVSIHLPRQWENEIDLRKIFPEADGHVGFRLRIKFTAFRSFVRAWAQRKYFDTV
jgi:hypothetical protein